MIFRGQEKKGSSEKTGDRKRYRSGRDLMVQLQSRHQIPLGRGKTLRKTMKVDIISI